jgi:hypothetical protein
MSFRIHVYRRILSRRRVEAGHPATRDSIRFRPWVPSGGNR